MWQELSFGQQGLVGCLLIMVGFALFLAQNLNLPMGFFIKQIFISPVHFLYSKLASLIFPTKISRRKSGSTNSPVTGPQQRKSIITNSAADEHSIKPGKI
jgi:hypothetical protein